MDPHRPSFPNPPGNTRFPPPFYPPPNPHHHNHHQHHHHHQQLPPPPRLPPPPPQHIPHQSPISLPPPPPPPNSFHHHHPGHGPHQFANPPHRGRQQQPLDPILAPQHRNHSHNLNNRLDFSQPPPRVTDRLVYDDDRRNRPPPPSRGFDGDPYRRPIDGPPDWNTPPRVPFDAPPPPPPMGRRISRGGFDREPPPYGPPFQPVDRFRNNQDGDPRVRKEFNSDNWFRADELPRERRDNFMNNENFHRDRRFERDIDRDIHRNEFVSTTAEQFSGLVPQEELIRKGRGDMVDENLRWDHLPRGAPHSPTPTDLRSRAIDSGNGFYEKGKVHVLDSDRFDDRDRWEDAQDFNLTPRKKQKRKNAFLRLQPGIPSLRNSYESSPSLCRDREPSPLPDQRPIKERERSPIVSFESNLLIVASSTPGAVADGLSAFGDDKNRNEVMDNMDDLVSPSDVVEKVPSKIDSDNHCGNGPCTLEEQERRLEKNSKPPTYPRKAKSSVNHGLPVANAEAMSNKAECLSEDKMSSKSPNGRVLGKSYPVSGPGKESSPNFRKKRKSTNPHSSISLDNLVNSSSSGSMLDEGLKDSGKVLASGIIVTKPAQVTAIGSSKTVDEKRDVESVSVGKSVPKIKRRKTAKPRPCTSRQTSGEPGEIPVHVIGPIQGGQTISNSEGAVNKIQNGSSLDVVVNDSSNTCLDVVSVPHQQTEGSSGATSSVKRFIPFQISTRPRTTQLRTTKFDIIKIGCANVLSASDSKNNSVRQLNCSKSGVTDSALISGDVSAVRHKKNNFADIVNVGSQSKTSSSKNGAIEEYMNTKPSVQDSKSTNRSSSEEFRISESPDVSCCKESIILAADNAVSKNSEQLINGSDACIVNHVSKLSFIDRLSASTEVGVSGGFTESETMETDLSLFPAEGSLTKNNRKRKVSELHRGSGKISAECVTLTLGRSIDTDRVQDKIADSWFTCPDAQLKLCIGDCLSMNGSEEKISSQETGISVNPSVNAYPSEVITSTCNKKIKVLASDALSCDADVLPHSIQALPLSSAEVRVSVSELASPSDLANLSKGLDLNCCNVGSPLVSADMKLGEEACGKESSNFVLPGAANVSDIPDEKRTSRFSESKSLPQGDGTLLMTGVIDGCCGAGVETGSERSIYNRTVAGDSSLQNQCTDQNISQPEPLIRDLECDINIPVKDDLSSRSKSSLMTSNASLVDSPENLSATASVEVFDVPNLNGKPVCKKTNEKSTERPISRDTSNSSTSNNIVNFKMARDGIVNSSVKTMPFIPASQSAKEVLQSSSNERKKQTVIKNELNLPSSKALSSRSSFVPSSSRGHTTVIKPRTWHRTDNPNPPSKPPAPNSSARFVPRQTRTVSHIARAQSNSYVRKGNSLLRNPATAVSQQPSTSAPAISVVQLNLSASVDSKNSPCEMPEKVTSPYNIDSSNCDLAPVGDSRCSPVSDSSMSAEDGSQRFLEDKPKSPVNSEFQSSKSLEDLGSLNHINHSRRMVYIKHKSNQLVAAPNSSTELSASSKDLPALMSDVYFKRKKNQLVRATAETHHSQQTSADPDDGSNSEGRRVVKSYVSRSATKKYPNRVSQKIPKSRKFSLVWKLCNTRSPKKGVNSVRCQQVLPHLLPWKRATYWRSLFRTSADLFKNSPLSHKLASSRKRHIIYKRSGFSLRRSKVVSLAGSSLKWSISLERRSTKVDKEAKLAVAALEKGKREKNSVPNSAGIESKNKSSHAEHSVSGTGHQVKNALRPSIPRRRLIGNDEYVRIGNGNQLIRNPKRRTRILASEKVRWSLHTARMRLAKKRKYCQFFTRFGKCNKEEGKCPYIHDPSKNAVCTKFLNGLCSDPKCKLTHEVIPERMPDCSFFLQGTCSNESCPYRHVSVNPKAAICGNFLKGYCAEGNECRKKHSYSCPVYEATGECPEGSRCKLYHSRKGKDKKGKKTRDRRNTRSSGRYFGSNPATGTTEPETEGCGKRLVPKDDGIILEDGSLADFISLDASDEEDCDQEDEANKETNLSDGEQPSFVSDDPDELIKPIRLLRIMSQAAKGQGLND